MDYKVKLEEAKRLYQTANADQKYVLESLFPELKESEDEMVRKWLIELVEEIRKANPTNADHNGMCSEAVAWLEKQGEPKSDEWSEEDEKMCQETIDWFEKKCFPYALESENPARESIKWLKSLKQRIGG